MGFPYARRPVPHAQGEKLVTSWLINELFVPITCLVLEFHFSIENDSRSIFSGKCLVVLSRVDCTKQGLN